MKKIIFRFLIFTSLLIFGSITYLSIIGIKTDAFNKSNALLLDLSFAKGNADRKKINVIIVTPTK